MNALAIDLGTTAAKVSVVAENGAILGSGMVGVTTAFGSGGRAEQDAEAVWQAVINAAQHAIHEAGPVATRDIGVACATSQWSSIVPVNAQGRPVGPMMTWMDQRGQRYTKPLARESAPGDDAARAHANSVHGLYPGASLGHMLYSQQEQPQIHDSTAAYLEPMDYLNARLCGRIVATGCTAMPLSLTDNRELGATRWSTELITSSGVDASKLPELVPSLSVLGPIRQSVATTLGLLPSVLVVAGANDSVAAALGTAALEPGQAAVVMGTTGVLTAHHRERIIDRQRFILTMPSALNDRLYVMAEAGLGGKVLEHLLQEIIRGADHPPNGSRTADLFGQLSEAVAEVPVGSDGLLFLPWLLGSAAPRLDSRQRGAFLGLSLSTTRGHMLRSILEGISLQMRWLTDEVEAALGVTIPMVRFAGGGAQSDVWAQTMADVLGRSVDQLAEPRQANTRGAGFLGFLSLGLISMTDIASMVPIRRQYEPVAAHASLFDERIDLYRQLHAQLGPTFARLTRQQHTST